MEKVLRHRAKSMVAFVRTEHNEEKQRAFFAACLDAHSLDTLKDLGKTL
jgi:hypothetical protein